jgi:hypothetical protein
MVARTEKRFPLFERAEPFPSNLSEKPKTPTYPLPPASLIFALERISVLLEHKYGPDLLIPITLFNAEVKKILASHQSENSLSKRAGWSATYFLEELKRVLQAHGLVRTLHNQPNTENAQGYLGRDAIYFFDALAESAELRSQVFTRYLADYFEKLPQLCAVLSQLAEAQVNFPRPKSLEILDVLTTLEQKYPQERPTIIQIISTLQKVKRVKKSQLRRVRIGENTRLEQELVRAILESTTPREVIVYFVSGHNELLKNFRVSSKSFEMLKTVVTQLCGAGE